MSDNSFATARDLGTLSGTGTLKDFVGKRDKTDFYKFALSARSSFSLSLDKLNANVDISLFNAQDRKKVLAKSNRSGKNAEKITAELESGTYYIKINSADNRNTRYTLSSSATPPPQPVSYYYGYGLVDAAAAVASAIGQTPFPDVPDSTLANQWGLDKIKAPEVWKQGFKGQGVVVAVLDTGVNYFDRDLSSKIWTNPKEIAGNGIDDDKNGFVDDTRGWDFTQNDNSPLELPNFYGSGGHGTFVAGIIADDLLGVAPAAKVMPVKVSGDFITFEDDISSGIYYAVRNGANIINISLGGRSQLDPRVQQAIQFARASNVLIVAGAGNDRKQGATQPANPAFFAASNDYGIAVGAIDRAGKFADFSSPTGNTRLDYVVAPGVDVYSDSLNSFSNGGITSGSGTSFSTPYVTGVAALMLSANPGLTPSQIENYLTTTANFGGVIAP